MSQWHVTLELSDFDSRRRALPELAIPAYAVDLIPIHGVPRFRRDVVDLVAPISRRVEWPARLTGPSRRALARCRRRLNLRRSWDGLSEDQPDPVPVFPFGYDWRMPLEATEARLDAFVREVIDRALLIRHYRNDVDFAASPAVTLIGHSMGGLIIAGYLERYSAARVDRVVTLAAPFQGSYEAVLKLATGTGDPPASQLRHATGLIFAGRRQRQCCRDAWDPSLSRLDG